MTTSTISTTETMRNEIHNLTKSRAVWLPIALGSAALTAWSWLAFQRSNGVMGVAVSIGIFALSVLAFSMVSFMARTIHGKTGTQVLHRQLAQCTLTFTLLLLFVPEYLGRLTPPVLRSVLLLAVITALWVVLLRICRSEAMNLEQSPASSIIWPRMAGAALVTALTYIAIRKFYVFGYVGQDLAYFAQIMHTTLHGHLFWGSLLQDLLYSHTVTTDFAGHNSPIMFFFVPFYAVLPSPLTLLVLRNLIMAACAYPVYRIARLYLSDSAARLWAIAFLLIPTIFYQSIFDFYPLSIAALPLLFTLLYYFEGRFRPFCVSLLMTLLVREDLAFFAIALAATALVQRKGIRWSATPFFAGAAWAALSYLVVLPHALHGASFVTDACFSHLGKTPIEMVTNVCSAPQATLLTRNNIVYLKQLLTPNAILLAFANPLAIAALPFLAINLLAGAGKCITTVIYAQYSVVPATVLLVSTMMFYARGKGRLATAARLGLASERVAPLISIALCLATLIFATGQVQFDELKDRPWTTEARHVLSFVPDQASVAAPRYMLPALANRDCLYQTHRLHQYHGAVYEFLILDKQWNHINASAEYESAYRALLKAAPADPALRTVYESDAYLVLQNPAVHDVGCFPKTVETAK